MARRSPGAQPETDANRVAANSSPKKNRKRGGSRGRSGRKARRQLAGKLRAARPAIEVATATAEAIETAGEIAQPRRSESRAREYADLRAARAQVRATGLNFKGEDRPFRGRNGSVIDSPRATKKPEPRYGDRKRHGVRPESADPLVRRATKS